MIPGGSHGFRLNGRGVSRRQRSSHGELQKIYSQLKANEGRGRKSGKKIKKDATQPISSPPLPTSQCNTK